MLLGLSEKLLLKPKAGRSLQTERVPRSSGETKHPSPARCLVISLSYYFALVICGQTKNKRHVSQRCDDRVLLFCCATVLERLQSFLPQMAEANEKLKQQMEEAPAGCFDIESVEEAERVIEMVS